MFDKRSHRGFGFLDGLEGFFLCAFGHAFNLPAFACNLPVDLPFQGHNLGALFHAGIAGVGVDLLLLPVQQFRRLGDVCHVGGGDHDGMHQLAVPIRPDVRFHPEIPLVALAGLVHFRVAFLFLVLGGGRCGDQGGVHQGAFAQQQAAGGQVGVDGGKEAFAQVMRFKQTPEFQERGGVGHPLGGQINAGKSLQCLAVVERVFEGFVGQPIPLLEKIHPQHPLQPDGRASPFAFGIKRFDNGQQFGPWNEGFHAREELLAASDLLFIGKLGLGKTRLVGHALKFIKFPLRRLYQIEDPRIKSAFP